MCIEIIKNPLGALEKAKKSKNTNKPVKILVESSILFALTAIVAMARASSSYSTLAVSAVMVFLVIFVFAIIVAYALKISVNILGGKGGYYEGLTAIAYSLVPIAATVFITSLLSLIPGGALVGLIILMFGFAAGLSLLYRSIKDLFKTDMITAFVAVSVIILVLFAAMTVAFGLSTLANLSALGGV